MRETFVYRDGCLVPKHRAAAPYSRGPRSELPFPHLIRDQMGAVRSMLDGQLYDSKSALRATYKAAGVEEIGTDVEGATRQAYASMPAKPPVTMEEIAAAVNKVKQGYRPAPLSTEAQLDAMDADISTAADRDA
jgi:hypothetical protein